MNKRNQNSVENINQLNNSKSAGIYLHIPFCKTRCTYCDFYTLTNESQIDNFVKAICSEAALRSVEGRENIKTIYFGGGTPSRLNNSQFEKIFESLFKNYSIDANAEITVEANPDDLSEEYIKRLSELPVNRLSIGIQSFNDDELIFLSRRHSSQQAIDSVKLAQKYGFNNISVDLIYGLPNQTIAIWEDNLKQVTDLGIQHLSAYHLIYEEKTRMYNLLKAGKIKPVDEELSTEMFSMLIDWMTSHGFIQYEISAFGKEGFFSQHNTSYWKNRKYIGLGPAAHSYDGFDRSWNIASLIKYMEGVESGILEHQTEYLTLNEKYNEFILTGLRTMWGVDLREMKTIFGEELYNYCIENSQRYINIGKLTIQEDILKLTREGIFISDGIMSDLMKI